MSAKKWSIQERIQIVHEAASPSGSYELAGQKYGVPAMTVLSWEKELEDRQHQLLSASNTLAVVLDEDESLLWVGLPKSMYSSANWASAGMVGILLILGLLYTSWLSNSSLLFAFAVVSAIVISFCCLIAYQYWSKNVGLDLGVTTKRIMKIHWGAVNSSQYSHSVAEPKLMESYFFENISHVSLDEDKNGDGNLMLYANKDGKLHATFKGISDVDGMWNALPDALKNGG